MFFIALLLVLSPVCALVASWRLGKARPRARPLLYLAAASGGMALLSLFLSLILGKGFWMASLAVLAADLCIYLPRLYAIRQSRSGHPASPYGKLVYGLSWSLAAVLLCEVFVCNFASYATAAPMSPRERELSISEALVDGTPYGADTAVVNAGERLVLHYDNIDEPVKTIYADLSLKGAAQNTVEIAYSDATNAASLRDNIRLNYIHQNENSQYIVCSFFGDVGQLEFRITAADESSVTLAGITLNATIPFQFSWLRVGVVLALVWFLVLLAYAPQMKRACGGSRTFAYGAGLLTWTFLMLGVVLFLLRGTDVVVDFLQNPDTNQINKELVDAFRAGQVSLLEEPSQEFIALENPYDGSVRTAAGVGFPWDHLYYEGKYYSYYGIGPVLTLFLPYHLLTGGYFSSLWATLLYSLAGTLFLSLSYCTLVHRFFPKTPNGLALAGLVVVQSTSFVWYCITIGNFYELAQASGFAFITAGSFFLLHSGVIGKGKISKVQLCIATTLLSLAVLCRAALALYCLVALILIYAGLRKLVRNAQNPTFRANSKAVAGYLLAALLPFVLIGGVQMAYNYLRFGSVFDFGISYSLTINDFQHVEFQLPLALIAVYNHLVTLPRLESTFPFIKSNYDSLNVNGYYFLANFSAAGLLFRAAPILGYGLAPRAYRRAKRSPERRIVTAVILCGCLLVPLVQMLMLYQHGYSARYGADFAWQMLFGAFVILFLVYGSSSAPIRRVLYGLVAVSAVASFLVNGALTYEFVYNYADTYKSIATEIRSAMLSFGRLFEFWNVM